MHVNTVWYEKHVVNEIVSGRNFLDERDGVFNLEVIINSSSELSFKLIHINIGLYKKYQNVMCN